MRLLRWAKVFGTGTALLGAGVVLGACGGYSNLGDLPGNGGADDGTGGMSSGANGGKGGTGMGATGNVGMGATGGTGMGNTGNVGMGATGGTGMGNTGNVGMGNTGNVGMGNTGNVGMGATGGTGMVTACMTAGDCPQPPPVCSSCADGATPCLYATCENGVCGIVMPICEVPERCSPEASCGEPCSADGSYTCDVDGACVKGPAMCPTPPACELSSDCVAVDICLPCGDGCARPACVDGSCEMICAIGDMCSTDMDCRSQLPDNVCTMGPWRCTDGRCSLRQKDCMAPSID